MSMPTAFETEIWDLTALPVLVQCAFRVKQGGAWRDYVGVLQNYKSDEHAWDNNDLGSWGRAGPAPSVTATKVTVNGGELSPFVPESRDRPVHLSSGRELQLSWDLFYADVSESGSVESFDYSARVYEYSTGELVAEQITTEKTITFPPLADGTYTVVLQIVNGVSRHLSPAKYLELTGSPVAPEYFYEENGRTYFYDPERNLGVAPSDPDHELNVWRAETMAKNQQQDVAHWIHYATSHELWQSEWTMLKLIVGADTGALPPPSRCLFSKATDSEVAVVTPENAHEYAVQFDPLARSIASWLIASDGTVYVGGERASEDGAEGALWQLHDDGTSTLLASSEHFSTGYCECAMAQQAHMIRRIVELANGEIYAQSLCSNFRYDPVYPQVRGRLRLSPTATNGHPGGRSMLANGNLLSWTTEAGAPYAGGAASSEQARIAVRFYNTYETQVAGIVAGGETGTVAHLDGNLALWRGNVHGVVQDRPDVADGDVFSSILDSSIDPDAKRRIARMTGQGWDAPLEQWFSAATHRLNRVARIGWHLVSYGRQGGSQEPLLYSNDGILGEFAQCVYRYREMQTVLNETGYETGLAPAFLPGDRFDTLLMPRRVVELGERESGRIHDGEPAPDIECKHALCQWEKFGPGAVWFGEPLQVWDRNDISGVSVVNAESWLAPSEEKPFTEYFKTMLENRNALIWARIDSDAAVDDLETYTYPIPCLSDLWMLPFPAKKKVEFVVVLPQAADKIEPLRLMPVC